MLLYGFTDHDETEPICLDSANTELQYHSPLVLRCLTDAAEEASSHWTLARRTHGWEATARSQKQKESCGLPSCGPT